MALHFRSSHQDSISESQIPILLDIREQSIDLDEETACPLCPETLSLLRLQDHLAAHMEEIALFVIPTEIEDNGDTESKKAVGLLSSAAENASQNLSLQTDLRERELNLLSLGTVETRWLTVVDVADDRLDTDDDGVRDLSSLYTQGLSTLIEASGRPELERGRWKKPSIYLRAKLMNPTRSRHSGIASRT